MADRYSDCECVIGGDFNANIDNNDVVASRVSNFIHYCMLTRCDDLFPAQKCNRYVNHSLNQESCIDYLLVSAGCFVNNFVVLDPEVNFSDHLPLPTEQQFTDLYWPANGCR